MNTNVQALKNLYVALGGELANVEGINTNADMINAIAGIIPSEFSSNSELPAVTSEDNGKVLTVVDGEWGTASVPTELPTVTATDDGKVLKVVEGEWAAATDEVVEG